MNGDEKPVGVAVLGLGNVGSEVVRIIEESASDLTARIGAPLVLRGVGVRRVAADRGVPVDDITVILMADHGVNLYGNAIMVNPKFAAEKPEVVKAFLRAFTKGLQETVKNPGSSVESVIKRNDVAKKDVELERLQMAIKDNIVTAEVKQNGYGAVDPARLDKSVEQIALTYTFKNAKPKASDIFDASFLPADTDRKVD